MKIAYILPSLANKGPIIVAKDLVNVMSKHGHECFVFYFDDKNQLHFQCPTQRIKMNTFIDFNSYDIIHLLHSQDSR